MPLPIRTPPAAAARLAALSLLVLLAAGCTPAALPIPQATEGPPPVAREFRGVWVAAVANLDWPSQPGLPVDSQKVELVRMLDRAQELGLNAFIFHVRTAADALYASEIEPWSEYLTGEQGRAPEPFYDPLEFAIREAHARGLELHAWFNPYRTSHPSARGPLASTHIANTHPELVREYGSYLWMDPGEDAVRERSIAVVLDVVNRYDVDGVHLDDYFYPYREIGPDGQELDFPDSASYARYRAAGGTLERSDWRRSNVDRFVEELYTAVKRAKPWVKVGISPIGTWRQGGAPQLGGFDAFEQIYADSRKWLMEGNLDYFVPQLYWPISRVDVSFPVLLNWWAEQNPLGRDLYAGLIPANVNHNEPGPQNRSGWHPNEILGQIYITRGHPGSNGHVHFRMENLMPDGAVGPVAGADTMPAARLDSLRARQAAVQARRDTLTHKLIDEAYAFPALVPAATWLDDVPPPDPRATPRREGDATALRIEAGRGEPPFLWVVQSRWAERWETEIVPAARPEWIVGSSIGRRGSPEVVWVSAVDRLGNQSRPVRVDMP